MFTEEQEIYLGDVFAQQFERNFNVVDGELSDYLQHIADRLVKEMPPSKIPIKVKLVDLPVVNAWAIPGGRVYVTRKLIVAGKSEDEVAGVIAHEIGHIIARQASLEISQLLREVLGVTSLKDRADVVAKYHQLIENGRRKPKAFEKIAKKEEGNQVVADTVAVYGVARTGFRPQAYLEYWDRFTENRGKTGNAFSDLFGATKPQSKRLREMQRYANALPASCISTASVPTAAFQAYQMKVVEYATAERTDSVPGLVAKKLIESPLSSDIRHITFSPDGKRLLAQDEGTIFVINREPFAYAFHIKAKDAKDAVFSPDSSKIVFHDTALRVEEWDVTVQKRTKVYEIARRVECLQSRVSSDAKYLACWNQENVLQILKVASGETVFEVKDFFPGGMGEILMLARMFGNQVLARLLNMGFTPDNRLFAAGRGSDAVVIDLESKSRIQVSGHVRQFMQRTFAFAAKDKMLGAPFEGDHGEVLSFPEGKTLAKLASAIRLCSRHPTETTYWCVPRGKRRWQCST